MIKKADFCLFAESSNRFGFDLYKKLVSKEKDNLTISPMSISMALTMACGGARGATAIEMQQTLHMDCALSRVMEESGKLIALLTNPPRQAKFLIANQLFGEKTYEFKLGYLTQMKRAYGAPLQPVDFMSDPETSRQSINAWVESQTEKRIKNLIPESGINYETRMVLVNAIYFMCDWATPFDKELTRPNQFHVSSNEMKIVPTMNRSGACRVYDGDGINAIELPYHGEDTSMVVLLPDSIDGLEAMEASITCEIWNKIVQGLNQEQMSVSMPRFTVEPASSIRLREPLMDMGMRTAFGTRANFTGIANPPSEKMKKLSISEIFHKGIIRVDEKGTEAAASTANVMRCVRQAVTCREFKMDHPFVFVIVDNVSGAILLMGRVTDPTHA